MPLSLWGFAGAGAGVREPRLGRSPHELRSAAEGGRGVRFRPPPPRRWTIPSSFTRGWADSGREASCGRGQRARLKPRSEGATKAALRRCPPMRSLAMCDGCGNDPGPFVGPRPLRACLQAEDVRTRRRSLARGHQLTAARGARAGRVGRAPGGALLTSVAARQPTSSRFREGGYRLGAGAVSVSRAWRTGWKPMTIA